MEMTFFSEMMVVLFLKVFALAFSGADFNFRAADDVSGYWLLIPAVNRLVQQLVASFKEAILLLIVLLSIFQLKEKSCASPNATIKSVTVY